MAFDYQSNPLRGVKVEVPETCPDGQHYGNLLIWGECGSCKKAWGLGDGKVFEKLDELKQSV